MRRTKLTLALLNKRGEKVCENSAQGKVELTTVRSYQEGDVIVLRTDNWPVYIRLHLDDLLPDAEIYLSSDRMDFPVPFGEAHNPYPEEAFQKGKATLYAEVTGKRETLCRISENPLDTRGSTMCYPHCTATAETRGESIFAARNTIDGLYQNTSHGQYPYTSWGEDENRQAEIVIDFGRQILACELDVLLRADFPHDNWWQEADIVFSDQSRIHLQFRKTKELQKFTFAERKISWVRMRNMQADLMDPSPFPALTQWCIIGRDI